MTINSTPEVAQSPRPPRSQWPYWVVVPVCGLTYVVYCLWFSLEAWGRRGEPKPVWFDAAAVLAFPGLFSPIPLVGPLVLGGGAGFGLVRLARWIRS